MTALYSADPVVRRSRLLPNHKRLATGGVRTMVDREMGKLFRPSWVSLIPASAAYLSPQAGDQLIKAGCPIRL